MICTCSASDMQTVQCLKHRQHGLVEQEALGAERPAGVGVEQGDDDGHVGAADRRRHVEAEGTCSVVER